MCDSSLLREYGLLGGFDTVCNMLGERIAVVTNSYFSKYVQDEDDEVEDVEEEDQDAEEEGDKDNETDDVQLVTEGIMYCELQANSQALATQLYYRFGARKGDNILVAAEGHVGAEIVAILTCMRLGVVFVPIDTKPFRSYTLDTSIPVIETAKRKISQIINNLKPTVAIVIGQDDSDVVLKTLTSLGHYRCALLDGQGNIVEQDATVTSNLVGTLPDFNPLEDGDEAAEPLYILHTSGSTGESKGVLGTYQGLLNRIAWQYDTFPFEFHEMILRRTPLTFIDSLAELFAPLLRGVPICGYLMQRINEEGLVAVIDEAESLGISRITLIPSQLHVLCKGSSDQQVLGNRWSSLKYVFISGEECPAIVIQEFQKQFPHANLVNLYGSTEVAGDVTYKLLCKAKLSPDDSNENEDEKEQAQDQLAVVKDAIDSQGQVSIGQVIPGNIIVIVQYDEAQQVYQVLPYGEIGEIMVLGCHVAKGYYAAPSSASSNNSSKFVQCPQFDYSLLLQDGIQRCNLETQITQMITQFQLAYLMGDMAYARLLSEGTEELIWVGRKDRQVKVRGNRIELEDIERQLRSLFQVADGIVITTVSATDVQHIPSMSQQTNLMILVLIIERSVIVNKGLHTTIELKTYLQEHIMDLYLPDMIFIQEINTSLSKTSNFKTNRQQMKQMVIELITQSVTSTSNSTEQMINGFEESENTSNDETKFVLSICQELWQFCVMIVPQASGLLLPQANSTEAQRISFFQSIDFFALGGNSITSIEFLWKIKQHYATSSSSSIILHQHHLHKPLYELANHIYITISKSQTDKEENTIVVSEDQQDNSSSPPKKRIRNNNTEEIIVPVVHKSLKIPSAATWQEIKHRGQLELVSNPIQTITLNEEEATLAINWSVCMKKCIDASPLLCVGSNNILLIGSHGGDLKCIDVNTGEVYWEIDVMEHIESAVACSLQQNLCFISSFLGKDVDGFAGHADANDEETMHMGRIRALNMVTGEMIWQYNTQGECKATVAVDDQCYHRVYGGCYHGMVYALDLSSGKLLDSVEIIGSVYATPLLSSTCEYLYVVTTQGYFYAFQTTCSDKPLQLLWTYSTDQTPVFSSPILLPPSSSSQKDSHQQDRIMLALTDGSLQCITAPISSSSDDESELPVGLLLWYYYEVTTAPIFSKPNLFTTTIGDEEVMFLVLGSHDGMLRIVHIASGQVLFQYDLGAVIFASPYCILKKQQSSSCSSNSVILQVIVATTAGEVMVLEVNIQSKDASKESISSADDEVTLPIDLTLQSIRKMKFPGEIFSSPVVLNNAIFVGCRDDQLYSIAWKP